jgi:hypothetical protein
MLPLLRLPMGCAGRGTPRRRTTSLVPTKRSRSTRWRWSRARCGPVGCVVARSGAVPAPHGRMVARCRWRWRVAPAGGRWSRKRATTTFTHPKTRSPTRSWQTPRAASSPAHSTRPKMNQTRPSRTSNEPPVRETRWRCTRGEDHRPRSTDFGDVWRLADVAVRVSGNTYEASADYLFAESSRRIYACSSRSAATNRWRAVRNEMPICAHRMTSPSVFGVDIRCGAGARPRFGVGGWRIGSLARFSWREARCGPAASLSGRHHAMPRRRHHQRRSSSSVLDRCHPTYFRLTGDLWLNLP